MGEHGSRSWGVHGLADVLHDGQLDEADQAGQGGGDVAAGA